MNTPLLAFNENGIYCAQAGGNRSSWENILLTHHPEIRKNYFNLCGHLHPGFKLNGAGRQQLKLRCFYKSREQLVLPAFGEFTGNHWISPNLGDQVFVITKKEVILVY